MGIPRSSSKRSGAAGGSSPELPVATWLADASMLSVALIWGVNMAVMKFALARIDQHLFNASRLLISAVVLGLVVWWQKSVILDRRPCAPPIRKQLLFILSFGFAIGFLYQVLFIIGIDRTSAGNTALIMAALPMWTAILAWMLIGEKLTGGAWIGLLVAAAGTMVVTLTVPSGETARGSSLLGNLLVSLATLCWALASVLSRPMMNSISPTGLAFCGVTIAVPFHFAVAGSRLEESVKYLEDPLLLTALLFSGAFSTGLAYAFWNYGVKILGTSHAAIYQNLVPVAALIAAWLILDEVPVVAQIFGGIVIVFGLVVMRKHR